MDHRDSKNLKSETLSYQIWVHSRAKRKRKERRSEEEFGVPLERRAGDFGHAGEEGRPFPLRLLSPGLNDSMRVRARSS